MITSTDRTTLKLRFNYKLKVEAKQVSRRAVVIGFNFNKMLLSLPIEITLLIINYLPSSTSLALSEVNRQCHNFVVTGKSIEREAYNTSISMIKFLLERKYPIDSETKLYQLWNTLSDNGVFFCSRPYDCFSNSIATMIASLEYLHFTVDYVYYRLKSRLRGILVDPMEYLVPNKELEPNQVVVINISYPLEPIENIALEDVEAY